MKQVVVIAAVLLAACLPRVLLAHHGAVTNSVLYLTDELVELEGEMTEVFWHNPHTRGRLNVVNEDGTETVWEIELGSGPQGMARRGLSADDFYGRLKIAGYVSRRGNNTLGPIHILLPSGVELTQGDREPRWGNERVVATPRAPNPALEAEERRVARSIFRTWGRREGPNPEGGDLSLDWLTDRGHELNAAYDPIADNIELAECRQGMPDAMFDPVPMRIVDEGDRITMEVLEYNTRRTIYMDSSTRPEAALSGTGYSTGRWVNDTLVITTTHLDWPYWSEWGFPQSDQATMLETLSVSNEGSVLNYSITITDPVMVTRPFTIARTRSWTPGIEIPPYNCVVDWED